MSYLTLLMIKLANIESMVTLATLSTLISLTLSMDLLDHLLVEKVKGQ